MTATDQPAAPPRYDGHCPECGSHKPFTDEHKRDLWQQHHPHEWNEAS